MQLFWILFTLQIVLVSYMEVLKCTKQCYVHTCILMINTKKKIGRAEKQLYVSLCPIFIYNIYIPTILESTSDASINSNKSQITLVFYT